MTIINHSWPLFTINHYHYHESCNHRVIFQHHLGNGKPVTLSILSHYLPWLSNHFRRHLLSLHRNRSRTSAASPPGTTARCNFPRRWPGLIGSQHDLEVVFVLVCFYVSIYTYTHTHIYIYKNVYIYVYVFVMAKYIYIYVYVFKNIDNICIFCNPQCEY